MRILYIEDDPIMVQMVRRKCPGYEILGIDTLSRAKTLLETDVAFDLLVVDLNLPDSNGVQTAAEFKRYGLPILILTGAKKTEFVSQAAILGICDYICKEELSKVDVAARFKRANEKHEVNQSRPLFSFTNLEECKRHITCPPFASISRAYSHA